MMRERFILFIIGLMLAGEGLHAERKDSVTVITITDPNLIPKNAVVQKMNRQVGVVDSSRFVRKMVSETPLVQEFQVSKKIYGSYTDYILDYIRNYHENHGDHLAKIRERSKGYFSLIDNVMRRYGIPKELKSLAIIESALNCNAVSPVGAVGPWQFMSGTARELGLRVDKRQDERRDFYKSTNAAARYLKYLHGIFHDWFLVIASYNCGPAPVLRAINSGEGKSFWDIKPKLPRETQNHVMAFIATTSYLDKMYNVLGLGDVPRGAQMKEADFSAFRSATNEETDVEVDEGSAQGRMRFSAEELSKMAILKVKGSYTIRAIAKILDEDPVRMKRWNPDFDKEIASSASPVHLRIPIDKLEKFIILKDKIINEARRSN